ncbi:hypothetical protein [Paraprevotella xylaniphila]|uniref:hypothetical protein n=1 Tax=Paraprevotella xylaniphila TaxID=454155 RepID=UPI0023F26BB3|nr:hypothetical protein [Paraprevotella xylaniphila]
MKIYFKTSAIIILSLLLTNCRKEATSYLQRTYEEAVKLHKEGNLNDAIFYYQLTALNCQYHPEDSLTYWWKAMCGQGEVWRQKNFLDHARTDFETVLQTASKYRLDTAEYIASRKLTLISLERQHYDEAYSYAMRAWKMAAKKRYPKTMTNGQENERILAGFAHALSGGQAVSDTVFGQLEKLAASSSLELRTTALKLLSLYEMQDSGKRSHLSQYIENENEYWSQRFQKFTDASEREKKQLIAERDAIAAEQKNTLFISLTIFTLLLGGSLYAMADHRRKHELDRIRLILNQKEQTIHILEEKRESSEKLLSRLKEKEERMAELERRAQKLDEMQKLFGDRKEDMEKATREMEELNSLKDQIQQKEKEWETTEQQLRNRLLYSMEIGRKLPTADNPHQPTLKEYTNLIATDEKKILFLKEIDYCFNNFASGLQKITPSLTMYDVVHCCLFRLGIRTSDIAAMCSLANSTISCRRKRLEAKMEAKT